MKRRKEKKAEHSAGHPPLAVPFPSYSPPAEDEASSQDEEIMRAFQEVQRLDHWELCHNLCSAVVTAPELVGPPFRDLTETEATNPFLRLFAELSCTCCTCAPFRDLAEIFLKQQETIGRERAWRESLKEAEYVQLPWMMDGSPRPNADEYVSLKRFISINTRWPDLNQLPEWLFRDPDINQIVWAYFNGNRHCFDQGIERACEAVFQGVPLYAKTSDGFERLPPTADDAVYLVRKYEHRETSSAALETGNFFYPEWAECYYFRWGDLEARERLFGRWGASHSEAATRVLRVTLKQELDDRASARGVPVLRVVQASRGERYLGSKLKPVVSLWPLVRDILGVSFLDAIYFVENTVAELGVSIYAPDSETNLWSPIASGPEARTQLADIGRSDYAYIAAHGVTAPPEQVTTAPEGWRDLRVTPREFDAILETARSVASAEPAQAAGQSPVPAAPGNAEPERPEHSQRLIDLADKVRAHYNDDGTFGPDHCRSKEKAVKKWLIEMGCTNTAEQQTIYVLSRPKNGNGEQDAA